MQLAPPQVVLFVVREFFRLGLDVLELYPAPCPWWREKNSFCAGIRSSSQRIFFVAVFAYESWRLLCCRCDAYAWRSFFLLRSPCLVFFTRCEMFLCHRVTSFMGSLWGDLGSDFLAGLWPCHHTNRPAALPKTWQSLLLHRWLGIWLLNPFL